MAQGVTSAATHSGEEGPVVLAFLFLFVLAEYLRGISGGFMKMKAKTNSKDATRNAERRGL